MKLNQKHRKLMENLEKIDSSRLRIDLIELSSKAGGGALPLAGAAKQMPEDKN